MLEEAVCLSRKDAHCQVIAGPSDRCANPKGQELAQRDHSAFCPVFLDDRAADRSVEFPQDCHWDPLCSFQP